MAWRPYGEARAGLADATESAGLTGFHFHDLRHSGNHIAAATGATLRALMGRMAHEVWGVTGEALVRAAAGVVESSR